MNYTCESHWSEAQDEPGAGGWLRSPVVPCLGRGVALTSPSSPSGAAGIAGRKVKARRESMLLLHPTGALQCPTVPPIAPRCWGSSSCGKTITPVNLCLFPFADDCSPRAPYRLLKGCFAVGESLQLRALDASACQRRSPHRLACYLSPAVWGCCSEPADPTSLHLKGSASTRDAVPPVL